MTRTMTMLLGIFALAISVLAVPGVAGAAPTGSVDSANRVIFNSGSLTGVFEGNVPQITFYETIELGRTTYQLNFTSPIEFTTITCTSTVNRQSVTINTATIKIDFVLKNWPFASTGDKLALQVNMHSDYNHFDLDQSTGTTTVDATNDEGVAVMEHPYTETSNTEQNV